MNYIEKFLPGWQVTPESSLGLLQLVNGKRNIFVTYPSDRNTACALTGQIDIPSNWQTNLRLKVGHDPRGGWTLVVKANGEELYNWDVVKEPWIEVVVDLSDYAGKSVTLELVNQPAKFWKNEWAYWAKIAIESRTTFGERDVVRYLPIPEGNPPPFRKSTHFK